MAVDESQGGCALKSSRGWLREGNPTRGCTQLRLVSAIALRGPRGSAQPRTWNWAWVPALPPRPRALGLGRSRPASGNPRVSGPRRVPGSDHAHWSFPVVGGTALQPPPTSPLVVAVVCVYVVGFLCSPHQSVPGLWEQPQSLLPGNAWAILASNSFAPK